MSRVVREVVHIVDYDDNEIELKFGSSDIILWEQQGNSKADLQNEEKAGYAQYSLLHFVAARRGKFNGSLEEFINAYDIAAPEETSKNPKGTK